MYIEALPEKSYISYIQDISYIYVMYISYTYIMQLFLKNHMYHIYKTSHLYI